MPRRPSKRPPDTQNKSTKLHSHGNIKTAANQTTALTWSTSSMPSLNILGEQSPSGLGSPTPDQDQSQSRDFLNNPLSPTEQYQQMIQAQQLKNTIQ